MTKMRKELLSLAESNALRGIAILGIMLHNYCHFLGFAVKENEYTFTLAKPVEEGIMLPLAARPPRQSFREGPSTVF